MLPDRVVSRLSDAAQRLLAGVVRVEESGEPDMHSLRRALSRGVRAHGLMSFEAAVDCEAALGGLRVGDAHREPMHFGVLRTLERHVSHFPGRAPPLLPIAWQDPRIHYFIDHGGGILFADDGVDDGPLAASWVTFLERHARLQDQEAFYLQAGAGAGERIAGALQAAPLAAASDALVVAWEREGVRIFESHGGALRPYDPTHCVHVWTATKRDRDAAAEAAGTT